MQVVVPPAAVVAIAFLLDVLIAEPAERLHPVVLFGRIVDRFDRDWQRAETVGTALAFALPLAAAGIVGALVVLAVRIDPTIGVVVGGVVLFSTVSLRLLVETAREVIALTESDLASARTSVRALVGRETGSSSPAELRSAAVESAAENLSDGLVAPLLAFTVGAQLSVAAGVTAATYVKAVNTMDSMLGYRSKPHGRASARLDDALMWVPARISAALLALVALDPGALSRARSWAREPSSPNSGWPMATLAAAVDVRLTKPGAYTLNPTATLPTVERANTAVRIVGGAGVVAFVLAGTSAAIAPGVVG